MADTIIIDQPEKVQNLDILDLVSRIDRACWELHDCVSATRHESTPPDLTRWDALYGDLNRKFQLYKSEPELDLPKYHPKARPTPTPPILEIRQNVDVMAQIQLLIALRTEMVFSGAAERVTGFSVAQGIRIELALERWKKLLDDITAYPEVDSPNSPDEKPAGTS